MEGRSKTAYLSEEARLEAQRRMLAEKFGLHDSDSDESNDDDADHGSDGGDARVIVDKNASSSASPLSGIDSVSKVSAVIPKKSADSTGGANATDSKSESENEAVNNASEGEKRSNGVVNPVDRSSHETKPGSGASVSVDSNVDEISPSTNRKGESQLIWPGTVLADPSDADSLPAVYLYDALAQVESTARRECRVSQITHYHSLYEESNGRRIVVDPKFICYVVGGHIRVLARDSTERTLLKGHGSGVCDIELACMSSTAASNVGVVEDSGRGMRKRHVAVLGSTAEDGSVFAWKIVREDHTTRGSHGSANSELEDGSVETVTSLVVEDTLHLEHPTPGCWYDSIAFRPTDGALLSDKGMGTALFLLDKSSPDLRVTEIVKIGERSIVLDKSLANGHSSQDGLGLCCAVWIDKDRIATGRGNEVCVWSLSDQKCVQKLSREQNSSTVSSIHTLHRVAGFVVLLVSVNQGRQLETWSIADGKEPIFVQRLQLYPEDAKLVFSIVSHDFMLQEFVVLSNVRGKALFFLHYREDRACFDAITEVPVKQAVLSLCVSSPHQDHLTVDRARGAALHGNDEIVVFCVQPRCIQKMQVRVSDCRPRTDCDGQVMLELENSASGKKHVSSNLMTASDHPVDAAQSDLKTWPHAPSPKKVVSKGISPTENEGDERETEKDDTKDAVGNVEKRDLLSKEVMTQDSNSPDAAEPLTEKSIASGNDSPESTRGASRVKVMEGKSAKVSADSSRGRMAGHEGGDGKAASGSIVESKEIGVDEAGLRGTDSMSKKSDAQRDSHLSTADMGEIVAAVTAAAKKVTAEFDDEGAKRATVDLAKVDRLIASVRETAESSMQQYVSAALKRPMTDAIIPAVSEIIANASASVDKATAAMMSANASAEAAAAQALRMTPEWFCDSFRAAKLASSFESACKEMSRQANSAVKSSMEQKYSGLVQPSVQSVEAALKDLRTCVSDFAQVVENSVVRAQAEREETAAQTRQSRMVDVREQIAACLSSGDSMKAMTIALNSGDSSVVTWLCGKLDASTFFEGNVLPESKASRLAEYLGCDFGHDTDLKISWLHELMLALEPGEGDCSAQTGRTLRQVLDNVDTLRRDGTILAGQPGLSKKARTLGRLIASLIN